MVPLNWTSDPVSTSIPVTLAVISIPSSRRGNTSWMHLRRSMYRLGSDPSSSSSSDSIESQSADMKNQWKT